MSSEQNVRESFVLIAANEKLDHLLIRIEVLSNHYGVVVTTERRGTLLAAEVRGASLEVINSAWAKLIDRLGTKALLDHPAGTRAYVVKGVDLSDRATINRMVALLEEASAHITAQGSRIQITVYPGLRIFGVIILAPSAKEAASLRDRLARLLARVHREVTLQESSPEAMLVMTKLRPRGEAERAIIAELAADGPLTCAELIDRLGLGRSVAQSNLRRLIENRKVVREGVKGSGFRAAPLYKLSNHDPGNE